MTKDEILKKLEKKEAQKVFIDRCLKVAMCPECGDDLKEISTSIKNTECFYVYTLKCESCDRIWRCP